MGVNAEKSKINYRQNLKIAQNKYKTSKYVFKGVNHLKREPFNKYKQGRKDLKLLETSFDWLEVAQTPLQRLAIAQKD